MSVYGITEVRVNQNQNNRIEQVRWAMFNVSPDAPPVLGELQEAEAHEVADRVHAGDEVYSVHAIPGGTVLGAKARYVVYQNGHEGIDTLEPENHQGRTLQDLPHF